MASLTYKMSSVLQWISSDGWSPVTAGVARLSNDKYNRLGVCRRLSWKNQL